MHDIAYGTAMAEAEDKQEAIREFESLSRVVGRTRNNVTKVPQKKKSSLYYFRPILHIQCTEIRSLPIFHYVVNRPRTPIC